LSLNAKTEARLMEQKVFPSALTEEVIKTVFAPFIPCCLYRNCKLDRRFLKASEMADLGLSKTAKFVFVGFFPITPSNGIGLIFSSSFTSLTLVSKNTLTKTINNGTKN